MPKTMKAKLLLGWMPEDEAINFLNRCISDPPLSDEQKLQVWREHRARVEALQRPYVRPELQKLTILEKSNVTTFLNRLKGTPVRGKIRKAIKLNPSNLLIHQFYVITERSIQYANRINHKKERINHCLGTGLDERHKIVETQQGTKTILKMPHFEFETKARPGGFDINERGRFISVVEANDRLLLWAGYHRTYAVLSQMAPDADGEAPLLILMNGVEEEDRFLGVDSLRPFVRDAILCDRPPVFADFFDPNLAMEVNLIQQRMEIHIEPKGTLIQATQVW